MLGEAITGKNGNFPNHKDAMEHCDRDHTDVPVLCYVDVVPPPKNLQFSDVTQTSFRATWEQGAPDVALYRIGWSKKGENNFQYVSINHLCKYSLMISTETALAHLSGQRRQREHGKRRLWNQLLRCLLLQQFSPSLMLCFVFHIRKFWTMMRPPTSWRIWRLTHPMMCLSPLSTPMRRRARTCWAQREHVRKQQQLWDVHLTIPWTKTFLLASLLEDNHRLVHRLKYAECDI